MDDYEPVWPMLAKEDPHIEKCLARASRAGISMSKIAKATGYSKLTLWRWRYGHNKPTMSYSNREKFINTVNNLTDITICKYVEKNVND